MRTWIGAIALMAAILTLGSPATHAAETPAAKPQKAEASPPAAQRDKTSYSIGLDVGRNIKGTGADLNVDMIIKGIRDAFGNQKPMYSDEERAAAMAAFQAEVQQRRQQAMQAAGEQNRKAGEAFLVENKKKPGVITLPDGLQYRIVKEGAGKKPVETDTVEVQYRGTLINGTEFDSSYKRGRPATFTLGGIIPGWREALKLMPVGSKWELYIPPQLAYGERGAGGQIGPNATLIFEVELLAIKEAAAKP
jgi:FKBP-type peptidyl-prolyl cis-trans isomerase